MHDTTSGVALARQVKNGHILDSWPEVQSTLRPGVIRSFWNATESTSPAMNLITSLHHRPRTPYTCHMFLSCLCEIFNVASTIFPDGNDLLTNKLHYIIDPVSSYTSTVILKPDDLSHQIVQSTEVEVVWEGCLLVEAIAPRLA